MANNNQKGVQNQVLLTITAPTGIFYQGYTDIVTVKTALGYIGLQSGRTPLFTNIEVGNLTIGWDNKPDTVKCYIGGGLIYADSKKINILTDNIINVKNIDLQRALRERDMIIKQIEEASHNDQVKRLKLESKLKKTLFKIDAYNNFNK
ncbi:F0F1 ATP synthase subunit epsilon [Mycoplasma sp. Pen4]|uniref:F0F1 ATP synthase subunit epsilon n=1 Tax=Mycoplasma sp. Pen4 TaxID=640330 RepID=UPI0016543DD2|nr:F0F1 ATP synthase subunit epsilon [Mycoplasma sp. Pen4]QNM93730.1 F0F1 ATP synthase subunit epsilon [Mycoplasma sp. Pen4]